MDSSITYIFRANLIDKEFTVYRDIAIQPEQLLTNFLYSIRQSFDFDDQEDSHLFLCDPNKKVKQKIPLTPPSSIQNWIFEPHQKYLYIYGPENGISKNFLFDLELLFLKEMPIQNHPICINKVGISPAQYRPNEIEENQFDAKQILNIKSSIRWQR